MDDLTKRVPIVIPSYEPDERLITLLNDFVREDMGPVIIVNDGSGTEYDEIFEKAINKCCWGSFCDRTKQILSSHGHPKEQ